MGDIRYTGMLCRALEEQDMDTMARLFEEDPDMFCEVIQRREGFKPSSKVGKDVSRCEECG